MWEPKLLARLDSIKRHLMTGMATHYVIDEIECLQRDLEQEMRATSTPRDYERYKPVIQWSGEFQEIKDIRLTDVPVDYDWLQPLEISLPDGKKVPYMMPIKYRSTPSLIIKIDSHATQGDKFPKGGHGCAPPKTNCPEYADGPLQHFLIKPGTQGEKKPKDALGLGPY